MKIAVINQSAELKGRDKDIAWMCWAWATQLQRDIMPEWGYESLTIAPASDAKHVPAEALQMLLVSNADVANALGYHDVDPHNGKPYIRVFTQPILANGGTLRSGPNSVSVTGSHELAELFCDRGANFWASDADGVLHAVELCDAVEQYAYDVTYGSTSTAVSNFVTQQFFRSVPENKKFDFMSLCSSPFQILDGGYDIYMKGGEVKQHFGRSFWDWKKAAKSHPASRTSKRMARGKKILASHLNGA